MNKQVGFATTSILEEMCKAYIDAHTIMVKEYKKEVIVKRYIGDPRYLTAYQELKEYNSQAQNRGGQQA